MRRPRWIMLVALAGSAVPAGDAWSATCTFSGPGSSRHADANWSCGHVPTAADDAVIDGDSVTFDADGAAGSLAFSGGRIAFSGGAELALGSLSVETGEFTGPGATAVTGQFTKTTGGVLGV